MDIAKSLKELKRKKRWVVLAGLIAVLAAGGMYKTGKSITYGVANAQILIDQRQSPLVDTNANYTPLQTLATVYSQFLTTAPVVLDLAKDAGVPPQSLSTYAPLTQSDGTPGGAASTAAPPVPPPGTNALTFTSNPQLPMVSVSSQAATPQKAIALANASATALSNYIASSENEQAVPPNQRVRIVELGQAVGSLAFSGTSKTLLAAVFFGVFLFGCVLILVLGRVIRDLRTDDDAEGALHAGTYPGYGSPGTPRLAAMTANGDSSQSGGGIDIFPAT